MRKTFGVCFRRHTPRCDKEAKRLRKWEDLFSRISLWLACSQSLKLQVAGSEGTFEDLLAKARLEEAKLRDLPSAKSVKNPSASTSSETVPAKEAEEMLT